MFKKEVLVRTMSDKQKSSKKITRERLVELSDIVSLDNALGTITIYHRTKKFWMYVTPITITLAVISVLLDFIMPMQGFLWNSIRAILALMSGAADFTVAYAIAVFQSIANEQRKDDETDIAEVVEPYVPYRLRYSVRQRRRQIYPFIAIIVVLAIASAYSHLYTFFGGIVLAGIVAMVSYVRPTDDEKVLILNDMPDARDILDIAEEYEKEEREREAKEKAKALKKARKKLEKEDK